MIEVPVEVRFDGVALRLSVRAASIRRALDVVSARYPRGDAKVVFPLRPETFFPNDSGLRVERIALESPEEAA